MLRIGWHWVVRSLFLNRYAIVNAIKQKHLYNIVRSFLTIYIYSLLRSNHFTIRYALICTLHLYFYCKGCVINKFEDGKNESTQKGWQEGWLARIASVSRARCEYRSSVASLTSMSSKAASTDPEKSLWDLNLYHPSFGGKSGGE